MADPSAGDLSLPQTVGEIRDDILTDVRLEMINNGAGLNDANLAVQPGTFTHTLATSFANTSYVTRSALASGRGDLTPLYCSGEVLEWWRSALQLADVSMSPSTGRIVLGVTGSATVPDGRQFVLPNGTRGHVVGTWSGVVDGSEVDVVTDDVGDSTQFPGGTGARFINPPLNVKTDATVSYSSPLTGGTDKESEARKRTRVLNRLAYAMGGANWGHLREIAFDALAQVQDCFVYPALGGPSSVKIVPVRAFAVGAGQYTRALDGAALNIVRAAIHSYSPDASQYVVQAAIDEQMDATVLIEIPSASQAGGDGSGWSDTLVWPTLVGAETTVTVSANAGPTVITVDADTTTAPVPGLNRVAWWSPLGKEFVVRTVIAQSGSTGAWVLTLDRPLIDSLGNAVGNGDYISPAATQIVEYGKSWIEVVGALGCGENATVAETRRKRHPFLTVGPKCSLTITELMDLRAKHPEITDAAWGYRSPNNGAPSVPASIITPPNILVPRNFGVYPI